MGERSLEHVVRHIRGLAQVPPDGDSTDAQLLERYVACRDEAAFAALARRHGKLMRGVCRHVLRSEEDVDDAVQATLLVLARKAGSIRKRTALGSWLHGVAYRISLNASKMALRRQAYEKHGRSPLPAGPVSEAALHELQAMLDEEVERLPEKLRAPFVLCCLEGMSKGDAAHELGWKEGTVSGRIARARERLRQCLARRGIELSAALCATALAPDISAAEWSVTRVRDILANATGSASNVSDQVTALSNGAIRCMSLNHFKAGLAVLGVLIVLAAGVGLSLARQGSVTKN